MRILVVGAGAVGGYFGGRLLEASRDVTFLVRPRRAAQLRETGLVIQSRFGDATIQSPSTLLAEKLREPFDVVLLSCKAYDLDDAIASFAPAVGAGTAVLPLLNGMRHLDVLDDKLGAGHVLGGQCLISARLDDAGRVVHLNDLHHISFGERSGRRTERVDRIVAALTGARFEVEATEAILLEMWEKWVILAALAGVNCLMRATLGDIIAAGGADLPLAFLEEGRAIAIAAGYPPRPAFLETARARLTTQTPLAASMLGDLERGGRTEADHVLGDLLRRRASTPPPDQSLLRLAHTALKAQEARAARASAAAALR
jgi:2-dehydropantoate 2-reductase